MSWSTPPTFVTGQLIGATDLNAYVRDNPNYLLSGRPLGFLTRSAQYTFTNVVFADVDAANLILTAVLSGTRALVRAVIYLVGCVLNAGNYVAMEIIANSATRNGDATYGLGVITSNTQGIMTLETRFTGLTPGSNTFKLQSKCGTASGGTIQGVVTPAATVTIMEALEY